MAQRISRAKRALQGRRLDQPGDLAVVLRVLYLVYTAGHAGRVDLAGEAIRLARQLTLATEEPEARGLLALMLLNHARLPARLDAEGRIVTLDRQDRGLWDTREIAEGVRVLQSALAVRAPRPLPDRGRHRRPARRRGERRGDRLAADPRLVRRPRRPHRRPGAPGPRRGARAARSRSATSSAPPPGCARPTGCARCSASGTAGTPSAATCTSSAATSRPPPRRTRRPPAGPRTSPSATTWSARPPARGPATRHTAAGKNGGPADADRVTRQEVFPMHSITAGRPRRGPGRADDGSGDRRPARREHGEGRRVPPRDGHALDGSRHLDADRHRRLRRRLAEPEAGPGPALAEPGRHRQRHQAVLRRRRGHRPDEAPADAHMQAVRC